MAPSWYDFPVGWRDNAVRNHHPVPGIDESIDNIWLKIIEEEAGPDTKIVLAGFSQGAATSLYAAAKRTIKNLVAVIGLSGYMPGPAAEGVSSYPVPVMLFHGEADNDVPFDSATETVKMLKAINADVTLKAYPTLEHTTSEEEINDIQQYLLKILPPSESGGGAKSEL